MVILGLTGSIGMGKTTTANMLRRRGLPVWDADAAVHRLYAGPAAAAIETAFPGTLTDGMVDRDRLGKAVMGNPDDLRRLEAIVHPMVAADRDTFARSHRERRTRAVCFDIPLLFETGAEAAVDASLVVTAAEDVQRQRVLARPGMTEEHLAAILGRQMPDAEKRQRAHFIVDTGRGMASAERQISDIVSVTAFMA